MSPCHHVTMSPCHHVTTLPASFPLLTMGTAFLTIVSQSPEPSQVRLLIIWQGGGREE